MNRRGRPPYPDILTPREWEVLAFLREGLSNEQIAERLGITLRTAKFHVSEILSKLGVVSREEAARWTPGEWAPARRWSAWPLAARVAGALVVAATAAGLGVLTWGVLQTGGGTDEARPATDAEGLVQAALDKMESLESYRIEVVDSEPGGSGTVEVGRGGLISVQRADITSTVFGSEAVHETIFGGSAMYDRLCQDYPVACGPWTEGPRPVFVSVGTVPNPDWPLIALGQAEELRFLPEDSSRPGAVNIEGTVDLYGALNETFRRHLSTEKAEELLRTNRGPVTAAVRVSLSPDSSLINRIVVELPESELSTRKTIGFYYSGFNEVSVEEPADFVPMPDVPSPTS